MRLGHRRCSPCCPHKAGSDFAKFGQREKFLLPFFKFRDSFRVTEPERKKSKKLFGVQINSRGESLP